MIERNCEGKHYFSSSSFSFLCARERKKNNQQQKNIKSSVFLRIVKVLHSPKTIFKKKMGGMDIKR
jgi:hypothetical protein